MAISPQVFLCYGRPDREVAEAIVASLWEHEIECYDYLAKPVEDRLGDESHHFRYIYEAKLFVALISAETGARDLVVEELQIAAGIKAISPDHRTVYVCPPDFLREVRPTQMDPSLPLFAYLGRVDDPDIYIDRTRVGSTAELCTAILDVIPPELLERMQSAWNVNRGLYGGEFEALDTAISQRRPTTTPDYDAADLLAIVTEATPVGEFLELEMGEIGDEFNRAAFVCILGRALSYADKHVADQLMHIGGAGAMGTEVDALISEMRSVSDSANGRLEQTADVIRGAARVVALLRRGDSAEAAELVEAVSWPRTRRVLLCGVYGCARSMGDSRSAARALESALRI